MAKGGVGVDGRKLWTSSVGQRMKRMEEKALVVVVMVLETSEDEEEEEERGSPPRLLSSLEVRQALSPLPFLLAAGSY